MMFYTRTPKNFRKVDDVRLENGKIVIEDRQSHQQISLTASLPI
jgi:hypothetical protein